MYSNKTFFLNLILRLIHIYIYHIFSVSSVSYGYQVVEKQQ